MQCTFVEHDISNLCVSFSPLGSLNTKGTPTSDCWASKLCWRLCRTCCIACKMYVMVTLCHMKTLFRSNVLCIKTSHTSSLCFCCERSSASEYKNLSIRNTGKQHNFCASLLSCSAGKFTFSTFPESKMGVYKSFLAAHTFFLSCCFIFLVLLSPNTAKILKWWFLLM